MLPGAHKSQRRWPINCFTVILRVLWHTRPKLGRPKVAETNIQSVGPSPIAAMHHGSCTVEWYLTAVALRSWRHIHAINTATILMTPNPRRRVGLAICRESAMAKTASHADLTQAYTIIQIESRELGSESRCGDRYTTNQWFCRFCSRLRWRKIQKAGWCFENEKPVPAKKKFEPIAVDVQKKWKIMVTCTVEGMAHWVLVVWPMKLSPEAMHWDFTGSAPGPLCLSGTVHCLSHALHRPFRPQNPPECCPSDLMHGCLQYFLSPRHSAVHVA